MAFVVGLTPGRVYDPADIVQGKAPGKGTIGESIGNANVAALTNLSRVGDMRQYVMLQVGAALNLVNGNVVQYTGDYVATLAGSAGATAPNIGPLAVVLASVTASASQFIWCQVQGLCNALFDATTSAIPGAMVKLAATSGQVTAGAVSSASTYISGMQVMATVSAVGLGAVMLNYPRVIIG